MMNQNDKNERSKYTGRNLMTGVRLLKLGSDRGWTAAQLAESEGVSEKTIHHVSFCVRKKFEKIGKEVPANLKLKRMRAGVTMANLENIFKTLEEFEKKNAKAKKVSLWTSLWNRIRRFFLLTTR